MYYLTDTCFLCLKNNIKIRSVLTKDTDGIVFNEKLRCVFPEIINSTADEHNLACSKCLEKLRISYDFKQSVLRNNTVFKNYVDKLKSRNKTYQQLLVLVPRSKHRTKINFTRDFTANKDEKCDEKLTTNENDVFFTKSNCQTKQINLKNENIDEEEIHMREEPLVDDDFSRNYLDEDSKESEGSITNKETFKTQYKCSECQETFSHSQDLDVHKLTHAGAKTYDCNICQKSFKIRKNLFRHIRTHDNVRPYQCSVCKKTYKHASHLTTHMYIHSGQKPFHCLFCEYKTTLSGRLKCHMRSHTNEKPFNCKHCRKSYGWSKSLRYHLKKHHNEEDA